MRVLSLHREGIARSIGASLLSGAMLLFAMPAVGADSVRPGESELKAALATCSACHGESGAGNEAMGAPRLAGLGRVYFLEQLNAFANGDRKNATMQSMAEGLAKPMRASLADFYASLETVDPKRQDPVDDAAGSSRGAWLAVRGNWPAGVPACSECHGPGGRGVGAEIPPLAGLSPAYIVEQLESWQQRDRPAGPLGLMGVIANRLLKEDISFVAAYYGGVASREGDTKAPSNAERQDAGVVSLAGASPSSSNSTTFEVPDERSIPNDDFGREVRRGEQIFLHTADAAPQYVGSPINCASCHLDSGRRADSAPLWGAYTVYPAYRKKTGQVNTFAERIQGCFQFSENGRPPPLGDPVLTALETYAYWMAKGAPVGIRLPGTGYPKLVEPQLAPSYQRGQTLFEQKCVLCHGRDGQGQMSGNATVFPALWGDRSFNWGAGMEQIDNAAGFIKANMPLGLGRTLSDQEAWDVALFMDSHERPQDPRFDQSTARTREEFHQTRLSMYGTTVDGRMLGAR